MLQQLKHVGLTDKEARVYLALLELGPSPVLEIATKAGINRPTAYVQIESLKKMGLVSTQTRGKKTLFIAETPEQLSALLDHAAHEVEDKKKELVKILPELSTLFNLADEKPQVRFFEGKEGLLALLDDFLKVKSGELLGISNIDLAISMLSERERDEYSRRRVAKKIKSRFIYAAGKESTYVKSLAQGENNKFRNILFVPSKILSFTSDITIYDDKVAIAALKGKIVSVIIQHAEIADSFRSLFELIWDLGKQVKK